jgi:hypothetical protein
MPEFVHGDKACIDELFNRYRQPIYANALIGGLRDAWELGLELLIWLFSILPSPLLSGAILFCPCDGDGGDGTQQLVRSLKNCR